MSCENPTYGLPLPPNTNAVCAFGARTILCGGRLDFVPDRKDISGPISKGFKSFMMKKAEPWLIDLAEKAQFNPSKEHRHRLDDGPYHAEADTLASFGYVYIIAWEDVQ